MTKRLWQIHSWMGLIAGLGLLVIGLTGSVLVFREELDGWMNPKLQCVTGNGKARMSFDDLLESLQRQLPGHEIVAWMPRETGASDQAYVIPHQTSIWKLVFVNPHDGDLLGEPVDDGNSLTGWLLELHYTLLADHLGVFLAGVFATFLCLLGMTGVWLYRDFWRNFFTLRWGRSARIFFSDLHKMAGISSVAFNLILGFTGAYWNLPHAIGHLIEDEHAAEDEPKVTKRLYGGGISMDALMARAGEKLPGFQLRYLSLPYEAGMDIRFYGTVPSHNFLRGDYGSELAFDAQSGVVKEVTDIRKAGWWAQFVDMFTPLHYGTFGGLPVKILWCLGGLTPGILAVSGSIIWWKRRCSRRKPGLQNESPEFSSTSSPNPAAAR